MPTLRTRKVIVPLFLAATFALPAAAEDAHHPPGDTARPPATQPAPAQPHAQQPAGPGGMMGNMMQMMHQMMSTMQDRGAMHRMDMLGMGGMGGMGMMAQAGNAIEHVEGHIAFVKAELKITAAQAKLWDDLAAAMRANAKQLAEARADRAKAHADHASPVDRIAQQEKLLAARLEIVRRTKPALGALHAALSEDQRKTFAQLTAHRMGMR